MIDLMPLFPTEIVSFDELDEEKSSPVGKKRRLPVNSTEIADLDDYDRKNGRHMEADELPASHSSTVDNKSNPMISKSPTSSSSRKISRTDSVYNKQSIADVSAESDLKRKNDVKKNDVADDIANDEAKSNTLKAYYPKINYDPSLSDVIKSLGNENGDITHKEILMKLISEICGIESSGLKEYSDENKGRETLIAALQDLLLRLHDDVAAAVMDTVVFTPELTTDEKMEVESLERTLAALKQHSLALQRYETDISEVGKKYNIWMNGADAFDATHFSSSSQQVRLTNFPAFSSNGMKYRMHLRYPEQSCTIVTAPPRIVHLDLISIHQIRYHTQLLLCFC